MSYTPPSPDFDHLSANETLKEALGYGPLEYWEFFSHEDASKIIESDVSISVTLAIVLKFVTHC
jgi:hypothetical protein